MPFSTLSNVYRYSLQVAYMPNKLSETQGKKKYIKHLVLLLIKLFAVSLQW